MEELTIDEHSLKEIQVTAVRKTYRKFVLVLKGTQQILNLKVFKTQTHQKQISEIIKESKDGSAKPTKFVCGIIRGSNSDKTLTFLLAGNESVLEKMGIAESKFVCSVNPYPAENLKKNIKASNAGFNKAVFQILDSADDPIFQSFDNSLEWDSDDVKSSVEVASYYVKKVWADTREQAVQFLANKQPDEVEKQWKDFTDAMAAYIKYKDIIANKIGDAMIAEDEGKASFIEAVKAVNVGNYDAAENKLDAV